MNVPESFVSRWVRRKREAASEHCNASEAEDIPLSSVLPPDLEPAPNRPYEAVDGSCDPPGLPPIESIMANTDIRAFLQSRVPAELMRAALRRAWASDPVIRDFIGIAENQWDFNDPGAMPGFGALHEADDVPALLQQALGEFERLAESALESPAVFERAPSAAIDEVTPSLDQPDIQIELDAGCADGAAMVAGHVVEEIILPPKRHTHGGALPR